MREPAVLCCAMPMLHAGRNVYAVTRLHRNRFLAPFLIPSSAPDTDQNLAAAAFGMMDMPVVLTARLKGNIVDSDLRSENRCQKTSARKITGISIIGLTNREEQGLLILFHLRCLCRSFFFPDFLRLIKRSPGFRPSRIKSHMRQDRGNFTFRHTVFLSILKMIRQ